MTAARVRFNAIFEVGLVFGLSPFVHYNISHGKFISCSHHSKLHGACQQLTCRVNREPDIYNFTEQKTWESVKKFLKLKNPKFYYREFSCFHSGDCEPYRFVLLTPYSLVYRYLLPDSMQSHSGRRVYKWTYPEADKSSPQPRVLRSEGQL